VHIVIGQAIDNVCGSLLFINAFPDPVRTSKFIREGLLLAAASQGPATAAILKRLKEDEEYYSTIYPLVSTILSWMIFLTFFEAACLYLNFQGQS
jgi:hypothetical protein